VSERETVVGRPWLHADCCSCVAGGVSRLTTDWWYIRDGVSAFGVFVWCRLS
jgi:hypothetical protein